MSVGHWEVGPWKKEKNLLFAGLLLCVTGQRAQRAQRRKTFIGKNTPVTRLVNSWNQTEPLASPDSTPLRFVGYPTFSGRPLVWGAVWAGGGIGHYGAS